MLAAAQAATVISEDHNFWIDNMSIHHLRAVLLEAGRRLVEDRAIAVADDVFMLDPEELRAALATPGKDLRGLVAERIAQMQRQATTLAPPVLGTIPTEPPPDDPFTRATGRRSRSTAMRASSASSDKAVSPRWR